METHILQEGYRICTKYVEENADLVRLYGKSAGGWLRRGRLILLECDQDLFDARKQQEREWLELREKTRKEGFKKKMTDEIQKATQLPMVVTGEGISSQIERR